MVANLNDEIRKIALKHYAPRIKRLLDHSKLWPIDTGASRKNFIVQKENDKIVIGNELRYPIYVNNGSKITNSNKANPNYHAIQKDITRNLHAVS